MMWHHIILHATALVVIGFFVAFAAQRASGRLSAFGRYLSYWHYLLAVLVVELGALFAHRHGVGMMGHREGGWMHGPGQMSPSGPAPDSGGSPPPK